MNSNRQNYSSVFYIVAVNGTTVYYRTFSNGNVTTSYYYGDEYDYGEGTTGRYTIKNQTRWSSGVDVTSKYITSGTSATSIYYVLGMVGNRAFYEQISGPNMTKYNESLVIGDSITDNGDNTYTLNNTSTVTYQDWVTNYANYKYKYTCGDASLTCASPRYLTSTGVASYTFINSSEKILISKTRNGLELSDTLLVSKEELSKNRANYSDYKYTCNTLSSTCTEDTLRMITAFNETGYTYAVNRYFGESVTWDGSKYILNNVVGIESATNLNDLSTHHYTCSTPIGVECTNVAYIYYHTGGTGSYYYIQLENGVKSISDALDDMLYANNVNTKDSSSKRYIELWYKDNMLNVDDYLEETIYCNDRSITQLGGLDDDGGMTNQEIQFKARSASNDLSCENETDKFSVSNNKAKLKYKVGLATNYELNLIGNNTARKAGTNYWLMSPYTVSSSNIYLSYIYNSSGAISTSSATSSNGIRPVISLVPGIMVDEGTGTMADPYIVETE